ncbi:Lacal_2735 family protein [Aequorivita lipolytica]
MNSWFKKKSRIEILKERYRSLMRRSFEIALKSPKKSEKIHTQAEKIFQEIQYLSFRHADK